MEPHDIVAGIDGALAWESSLAASYAVWDPPLGAPGFLQSVRGRLAAGYATPHFTPKFRIDPGDVFFCIGSCFARVIERQLRYRNFDVASMRCHGEHQEAGIGANGVNKYTTMSMLNEFRWVLAGEPFPDAAIVADGDGYRDLQLGDSVHPVSLERARERRVELREYFGRLRESDVIVLTLGVVEVWYDSVAGIHLNRAPGRDMVHAMPGRFHVRTTNYAENAAALSAAIDLIAEHGKPGARVIVTISPVPMHRSFAEADVLAANVYSKSTLRAAAGDVVRGRPNADYFPAYELVTVTERSRAYEPDQSHVTEDAAEQIVRAFTSAYGITATGEVRFREKDYLRANPDVLAAVTNGQVSSGYEHWQMFGRREGRPLRPVV
jgi:GSCFA family